jgi:hypothetical protein
MQQITIKDGVVELQEVSEVKRTRLAEFSDALTAQAGTRTPILPTGTIHFAARGKMSAYTIEAPPARRTVRFQPRDGRMQEFSIPMPWICLLITFCERAMDAVRVFFSPVPVRALDQDLYHAPLPNRYAPDGMVCMGNFKFEITLTQPDKIQDAVRHFFESTFTNEILDSFNQFVPQEIAVKTGSGENWFHGWSRLMDEELPHVAWKKYKPLGEVVDQLLDRR